MLEQLLDYLKQDLNSLKKDVKQDMQRLEHKMDELIKFKWQIMGGTVVISLIFGVATQIMISIISNKHG